MQPIVLINQRVQNAVVYIAVGSIAMLIVALMIVMAKDKAKPIMDNVLRRYDFFIFMKASVVVMDKRLVNRVFSIPNDCGNLLPISQTANFYRVIIM